LPGLNGGGAAAAEPPTHWRCVNPRQGCDSLEVREPQTRLWLTVGVWIPDKAVTHWRCVNPRQGCDSLEVCEPKARLVFVLVSEQRQSMNAPSKLQQITHRDTDRLISSLPSYITHTTHQHHTTISVHCCTQYADGPAHIHKTTPPLRNNKTSTELSLSMLW